jgi:5'-nucleotidase / UDP-sugar diphosphatase
MSFTVSNGCRYLGRARVAWAAAGLLALTSACGKTKPPMDGGGGGAGSDGAAGGTDVAADVTTADGGPDAGTPQKIVILHTNDIHSHLVGFAPEADYTPLVTTDTDGTTGGMARLATAIGAAKVEAAAAGKPVMLLDAGDFMMGTLFELLATADPPELKFLKALGYDATTIGNHELDWAPQGLAAILGAAKAKGNLIPIVSSNLHFDEDPDGGAGDDQLEALATGGAIQSKLIKTFGQLKVGFFGLLGADAVTVTPQSKPLTFDPIATAARKMVTELRETDKVDLVIALSHSGIDATGKGEDADLAAAVPGIDIIISGHTHDKLTQPKIVHAGDGGTTSTIIVTAGAYGQYLGKLELSVTPAATPGGIATVTVDQYTLMPIDDTVMGDATTQAGVDQYIAGVDTALTGSGLTYKAPVAETPGDLALPAFAEAPVGDLVTDAYRAIAGALQPTAPPVIAVEADGTLRAPLIKGKTGVVWFADLFRVLPIGIGPVDQKPGFPLVTFYLNAKDIKSGLELGGAPELVNDQYFLQVSGLKVEYDMTKPPFGRVSSLKLVTATGDQALDVTNTTTCYKIVATNFVAGLLGVVKSFTSGALQVVAKDADCTTPIDPTLPQYFVDADPTTAGTQELKHYQALLKYVTSFPDTSAPANGIKDIPATYVTTQGRITKK